MALKDNTLNYSRRQIDEAGANLSNPQITLGQIMNAYDVLNNFRACHAYPMNTFQATLRYKLNKSKIEYLVSQRLKRIPSVLLKLDRFKNMRLSQMQDVGGLRAILPTIDNVNTIVELYQNTAFQHEIKNVKDYIAEPKESGYRCYHIVYKYKNKINPNYDGLMIELQIRTKLQHAWATAVETMGTFIDHSLKSSQGPQDWLDFFSLVGNAFAYIENTPNLPKYSNLSKDQVFEKIRRETNRLQVITQLESFSQIISNIQTDKKQGSLHLIVLDITNKEVRIKTYSRSAVEQASSEYLKEESQINDTNKKQVVLVSSDSIDSLKKAYPSYFLDTQEFISILKSIISNVNVA